MSTTGERAALLRGRIARARAAGTGECLRTVAASVWLHTIALLSTVLGLRRAMRLLQRLPTPRPSAPVAPLEIPSLARSVASTVERAARMGPWRSTCLHRSLTLRWLLARRGVATSLRWGTRRAPDGSLSFHAWVELSGVVLNDRADVADGYQLLDIPDPGPVPEALRTPVPPST